MPGSGGDGQHRGGLAQEIEIEVLGSKNIYVSTSSERIKNPPRGYRGGLPGAAASLTKNRGEYLAPKGRTMLKPGERVTVRTPGGGGYGRPAVRDPRAIAADVASGYVQGAAITKTRPRARKTRTRGGKQ